MQAAGATATTGDPAAAGLAPVRDYWDAEPCGERYARGEGLDYYEAHARERYTREPWIRPFARFEEAAGLRVLEVGCGMGADYLELLRADGRAIGIDVSERSLRHAQKRCRLASRAPVLAVADAERLPFADASFDRVYSWGVAHHSPDTARVFREIGRVLRPGGLARIAIYHHPSWGGFLVWGRNALLRGRPLRGVRAVVAESLESPGTRLFTRAEARELCAPFSRLVSLRAQLGLGDLLAMDPSAKYRDALSRLIWRCYPRWLIRRLGQRWGGYLLIECER